MYLPEIRHCPLFRDFTDSEFFSAIDTMNARKISYEKNQTIFHAGDKTGQFGIVITGSVTIESNDYMGNCTILNHIGPDGFFAESYCISQQPLLVDVKANEACQAALLSFPALTNSLSYEGWQLKLYDNLLHIISKKNLKLSERSFHTAGKTIRSRVLSYLNETAIRSGKRAFDIPFNRQQMADYLNVERTALCKELKYMKSEGILYFHKNHFELL